MKTLFRAFRNPFHRCNNSKGMTSLEVAMTMIPFLMATTGIAEFGWYYLQQHTLQSATREGIRIGLLGASLQDGDGNTLSREDSIVKAIQDKAGAVMHIDSSDVSIYPVSGDFSDPDDVDTLPPDAGGAGSFMRVKVSHDHHFFSPLIGGFFSDTQQIQFQAVGTYRNEDFILGGS